jgi:hypothetical protein
MGMLIDTEEVFYLEFHKKSFAMRLPSSEPAVLLIPFYGEMRARLEVVLRLEAQFINCRLDVAPPVALLRMLYLSLLSALILPVHLPEIPEDSDDAQEATQAP